MPRAWVGPLGEPIQVGSILGRLPATSASPNEQAVLLKRVTADIKFANAPRGIPVTSRGSSGKAALNARCQCTHGMGYDKATLLPQVGPGSELTPKLVKAAATAEQGSDGWFAVRQGRGTGTTAHALSAVGEAAVDALPLSIDDLRAGDTPARLAAIRNSLGNVFDSGRHEDVVQLAQM